jgi:hypothetical protein
MQRRVSGIKALKMAQGAVQYLPRCNKKSVFALNSANFEMIGRGISGLGRFIAFYRYWPL